jgi:hypothetical protein
VAGSFPLEDVEELEMSTRRPGRDENSPSPASMGEQDASQVAAMMWINDVYAEIHLQLGSGYLGLSDFDRGFGALVTPP